ncbi:hypothetical protein [Nocardioides sp.]|uniref:hypothetical protein n=1 Tax=Nocardioides sp. TaxID=35761 RepID=UPI00271C2579|nr:hypothetical protein [Nocardioides sp.]MDO9454856.1 hypothetical protein [Nocardioides sp.]
MDDASYGALALALTLVAGVYTWFAYQRRGLGAGLKGAGITVLPIAAYLTRTLRMFAEIGEAIGDWAARLAFSPVVWVGIVLAGVGVVLFGAGRVVDARGGGTPPRAARSKPPKPPKQRGDEQLELPESRPASGPAPARSPAPVDDDLADIEALLKSRGIT